MSPAGARGIAQFIPSTAKAYGVNLNDSSVVDDLEGAARYDRDALKRTGGDWRGALSIYNSGRPNGYKSIAETRNYVQTILGGSSPKASAPRAAEGPTGASMGMSGDARQQLLLQYLQNRGRPGALLQLASGLREAPGQGPATQPDGLSSSGWGKLLELFYDPEGGIKNGQEIGAIGGHGDHVHVASGPKATLKLAKLAQSQGLTVREFAPFDKVDPVHVPDSYHYKGEAADISGTPDQMRDFYLRVKRLYGVK